MYYKKTLIVLTIILGLLLTGKSYAAQASKVLPDYPINYCNQKAEDEKYKQAWAMWEFDLEDKNFVRSIKSNKTPFWKKMFVAYNSGVEKKLTEEEFKDKIVLMLKKSKVNCN
tara:strand:+ start:391 stop:729 length:339 start_codon:yes stop_codon:yes gene_type:complete